MPHWHFIAFPSWQSFSVYGNSKQKESMYGSPPIFLNYILFYRNDIHTIKMISPITLSSSYLAGN